MRRFDDLEIGSVVTRTYAFSPQSLSNFANLVGDHAPVHMDTAFACKKGFSGRIVHGFFVE
jgi:acyl dehydratase